MSYDSHMHWSRMHAFMQYRFALKNYSADMIEVDSNRIGEFALNPVCSADTAIDCEEQHADSVQVMPHAPLQ